MNTAINLTLAACAALILGGASLLDGPSENDLARATALSVRDAQRAAQKEAWRHRTTEQIARDTCKRLYGQRAHLLRLDSGEFVCRQANA